MLRQRVPKTGRRFAFFHSLGLGRVRLSLFCTVTSATASSRSAELLALLTFILNLSPAARMKAIEMQEMTYVEGLSKVMYCDPQVPVLYTLRTPSCNHGLGLASVETFVPVSHTYQRVGRLSM